MAQNGAQTTPLRWKPLIVCPHTGMARSIQASLTELGFTEIHEVSEYPRPGTIAALAAQNGCTICFLDVASNQDEALPLLSEAVPVVPVVAMNPVNDADLILRCLRRGACEFVSEATAEQVSGVLARLAQ